MYFQLSLTREPTINDCKPLGTLITLDLDSRIDELESME
jgi:hypothetical protein